jgi:hypothetical protein
MSIAGIVMYSPEILGATANNVIEFIDYWSRHKRRGRRHQIAGRAGSTIVCALIMASPILTSRSLRAHALRRHARAFEQQEELVRQHFLLSERGRSAQLNEALALCALERIRSRT